MGILPENIQHQNKTLEIRTLNGQTIRNNNLPNQESFITLSVDDLPSGMYIIELQGEKKRWRGKFIKR
jgi:Secretion system C-terminal sorting domain